MSSSTSDPVKRILNRLENVRPNGNGQTALCPAHDDRTNSLSVGEGSDGRVLLKCFAGCDATEIVTALGLEMRDLFPRAMKKPGAETRINSGLTLEEYARVKGLPVDFLKELGIGQIYIDRTPAVRIPYLDLQGVTLSTRIRLSMQGDARFRWKTGSKPFLYGLWRLQKSDAKYVCLVEGESDCHTLWLHRFPALGLPGAANWQEAWSQYFERFERIYLVIEPDMGGSTVRGWLRNSRIRDRVRLIMFGRAKKDPSALYLADPKHFAQAWKAAMKAAIPWSKLEEQQEEQRHQSAPTQANRLIRLADTAQLFHTPEGEPFASVAVDEHTENWPLRSRHFRHWLLRGFYLETKSAPQHQALQEAISVLESKATFEGPECPVFVRLAEKEGKIYVDLCDDEWKAVEIDANGWRVLSQVPVRFRRARGMSPLSHPLHGGLTKELRRFVNVASEADWHLLEAWLMAALRPRGPYPILVLHGEQGSAKSTTSRVLRALVDPSTAPLRSEPRELRDLMIAASNGWVINLDNLSRIHTWLSDALCRLSTGGGFGTRELFTDRDETLFDAQRPVILNGIEELAVRGDLLDRALILYLPPIPEQKREPESKFWGDFELRRAAILGAFLNAVSGALRRLPHVQLSNAPRLADFAFWATAAEPELGWREGAFLRAYARNQSAANDLALEGSPITEAVRGLVCEGEFEGTASELLKVLTERTDESISRRKGWPQNGQWLSNALRRLAPNLRKCGIEVLFSRGKDRRRRRLITMREMASEASASSKGLAVAV